MSKALQREIDAAMKEQEMIQEYVDVFGDNVITHNRFEKVGVMSKEECINYGVTGPAGRASVWENDELA